MRLLVLIIGIISLLLAGCQLDPRLAACNQKNNELQKNLCFLEQAREIKDPKICRALPTNYEKGFCYEGIALGLKNPIYCTITGGKTTDKQERCLFHMVREYNDSSICEQFKRPQFLFTNRDDYNRCLQLINGTLENPRWVERPEAYNHE